MSEFDELKRLAERAPGGPWIAENNSLFFKDDGYTRHLLDADAGHDVEDEDYYATLKFITAANPAVVLELIKDLERNQRMLLAAAMDMGAIGGALKADMNSDGEQILSMVADLIAERDQFKSELKKVKADRKACWAEFKVQGRRFDQLNDENADLRKDAERWRFVRNPVATGSPFAIWSERTNLFLGKSADEAIDAAIVASVLGETVSVPKELV